MKARKLLTLLAVMAVAIDMVSCSDKKNNNTVNPTTKTTENYFSINGADYIASSFPTTTSDVEVVAVMNPTVVPGTSDYVTVATPVAAEKVLVGVKGAKGYYEVEPSLATVSKEYIYDFIMIANQSLTETEFVVTIAILDEDGEVSETFDVTMHLVTAGTGQLQVSLAFDTPKDLDLHLFEPNGYHIFYGDRESENGGELDLDSNPSCAIDNINHENIFYGDDAYVEPGVYTVYVDMWENCDTGVNTNFVVTVFYNGEIIPTVEGVNPIAATFAADEPSNYANIDDIQPICHFIIPDNGDTKPAKSLKKGLPKFLRSAEK